VRAERARARRRRTPKVLFGAVLAATLLVDAGTEAASPRSSGGCGRPATQPAGETVEGTIPAGDLLRLYRLRLPEGYDPSTPAPLVLVFHGYTDTAPSVEETTASFRHRADRGGAVLVYPQATHFKSEGRQITSWNDLVCNASPGPLGSTCTETAHDYPTPPECGAPRECDWCTCHDDVGFVKSLLDELEETLCLDLDRVFATGISNGGMFVHRLGCDLPDRFAAVAPVAGTLARGLGCAPSTARPIALMNIFGTADTLVPADGSPGVDGFLYAPSTEVTKAWAAAEGCAAERSPYATLAEGVRGFRCAEQGGCASGAEVVDCSWEGGHDWPRTDDGAALADPIWDFFERNGRRQMSSRAGIPPSSP
jgi:polyhydroxybutyrate depolymerase